MDVQGKLLFAQLQDSASDLTPVSTGLLYWNTATGFPKIYNGSAWKTLVDDSTPQIITYKQLGTYGFIGGDIVINVQDTEFIMYDSGGTNRYIRFDCAMPADNTGVRYRASTTVTSGANNNLTIVDESTVQTLTNKTITGTFTGNVTGNTSGSTSSLTNQGVLRLYELTVNGTNFVALKAPDAVTTDTTWKLPDGDGTVNQLLKTDGAGNLGWVTAGVGVGDVKGYDTLWVTLDGMTKAVVHGLTSSLVDVTVIDLSDNQIIMVDTITVTSTSTVTLTATEAPSASSWRVVVQAK